jgi:hypothetical protein
MPPRAGSYARELLGPKGHDGARFSNGSGRTRGRRALIGHASREAARQDNNGKNKPHGHTLSAESGAAPATLATRMPEPPCEIGEVPAAPTSNPYRQG